MCGSFFFTWPLLQPNQSKVVNDEIFGGRQELCVVALFRGNYSRNSDDNF